MHVCSYQISGRVSRRHRKADSDPYWPFVERYKDRKIRLYFRGYAAFASPQIYDYLEAKDVLYAIRLPANKVLQESVTLYRKINLQVQEGRVLLTGAAPDPETRVNAVRLAWQANGVREVINEIEVEDDSTLSDAAQDTWISTKLRARLIGDDSIKSRNYSIETVNGSVYLIGIAQDQAELDRVVRHARDISYVRRVVSYVRLKGAPSPAS